MDYSPTDFSRVAAGYGCRGFRVEDPASLEPMLRQALAFEGPSVVDVVVDPSPYGEQLRSLRG